MEHPFDGTPDGQRFILRLRETAGRAGLVQNWAAKLDGATPTGAQR